MIRVALEGQSDEGAVEKLLAEFGYTMFPPSIKRGKQTAAFSLRVACSMIEAWLMADTESFAQFFGVSRDRVPLAAEELDHAKRTMLSLCRGSRSRDVRDGMVDRSGNRPGQRYVALVNEFARVAWRPRIAAERAPSLARALTEISRLQATGVWPPPG